MWQEKTGFGEGDNYMLLQSRQFKRETMAAYPKILIRLYLCFKNKTEAKSWLSLHTLTVWRRIRTALQKTVPGEIQPSPSKLAQWARDTSLAHNIQKYAMYLCLIIFYTDPKGNIEWHLTHHQKQSKCSTFIRLKRNNSEIKESHCRMKLPPKNCDWKCLSMLFLAF